MRPSTIQYTTGKGRTIVHRKGQERAAVERQRRRSTCSTERLSESGLMMMIDALLHCVSAWQMSHGRARPTDGQTGSSCAYNRHLRDGDHVQRQSGLSLTCDAEDLPHADQHVVRGLVRRACCGSSGHSETSCSTTAGWTAGGVSETCIRT